jgi:Uma2 family endonuclease
MTTTDQRITTAEQLFQAEGLGRCELVRGELVMMSPSGFEHSVIIAEITRVLGNHVAELCLGRVTGAEAGFFITRDPDTVRAPDVAIVRAERIPAIMPRGFFEGAPDLAVEVVLPNDRHSEVSAKVHEWLSAGCRLVWVVDPEARTVTQYRSRTEIAILTAAETLTGGDVVPGFSIAVSAIFAKPGG